jgi:hypothetical protein
MDTDELKVSTTDLMGPKIAGLQQFAVILFIAGAVLSVSSVMMGVTPHQFFGSWLIGWLLFFGVTAGSLGLLLLHHTVGGGWGFVLRRMWETASNPMMFVLMLALFTPIIVGLYGLWGGSFFYPWNDPTPSPQGFLHDPVVVEKSAWLNPTAWVIRLVLYFVFFWGYSTLIKKLGDTQYQRVDTAVSDKLNRFGAFGILLFVLVGTFCSVDWVMSIYPKWVSSIFGLLWVASQALNTMAMLIGLLSIMGGETGLLRGLPTKYFRDLGNLTLAMVMMWAYLSFSQYLITFSGNTAEEVTWFTVRLHSPWLWVGTILIAFHFFFPFTVLLVGSNIKKNPTRLGQVAFFLVFMRWVDLWWLVAPNAKDHAGPFSPMVLTDIGCPMLIGGIWLWAFGYFLKDKPIVPLYDPRLQANLDELQEAHAHA